MGSTEFEQYREVFLEELEEQLESMDRQLLRLEQGGELDDAVQSLFRAAHTIKGSSAAMGFEAVKNLTHEMEQVLEEVRSHRLHVTAEMIDLFFACLDHLKALKENFDRAETDSAPVDALVQRLRNLGPGSGLEGGLADVSAVTEHRWNAVIVIDPSCEMKLARGMLVYHRIEQHARIVSCRPSFEEELDDADYARLEIECVTTLSAQALND